MQGCRDHFATANPKKNQSQRCDSTEQDRLDMSRRQPQSMVVSVYFFFFLFAILLLVFGLSLLLRARTISTTAEVVGGDGCQ
jgi:hypothetical protein